MRHQQTKIESLDVQLPGTTGKPTYLIYGKSGTGKTTLAATFPKPILLIDINDDGDESVEGVGGLKVLRPKTAEDLEKAFWYLDKHKKRYSTVVIDTITQMQALVVSEIASQSNKTAKKGKAPGAWGTMTRNQWGQVSERLKTLILQFRSLPCHTVFLAQEKLVDADEGPDDGVEDIISPEIGPAVMKSVANLTCASANIIGNTFIRSSIAKKGLKKKREIDYCMRIGPNPVYITKVRKPKKVFVPDYISDPSFEDIIKLRKGLLNGTSQEKDINRKSRKSFKSTNRNRSH